MYHSIIIGAFYREKGKPSTEAENANQITSPVNKKLDSFKLPKQIIFTQKQPIR